MFVAWTIIVLPATGPEVKLKIQASGAAPGRFCRACEVDSSETIGELVVDSPWGVAGASISSSSIASGLDAGVGQGIVALVASLDRVRNRGLAAPCTRSLAAILSGKITVSSRDTSAALGLDTSCGESSNKGESLCFGEHGGKR